MIFLNLSTFEEITYIVCTISNNFQKVFCPDEMSTV